MEFYRLRAAREQKGWSQSRVAEALGVTTRTIIRWEQGQAVPYPYYRQQLSILFEQDEQQLGFASGTPGDDQSEQSQSYHLSPSAQQRSDFLIDPMLPHSLKMFQSIFGRDRILSMIKQRLLNADVARFTALYGLPGSGKTTLVVALATDPAISKQFSDGVLWAGLGLHANVLSPLARWGKLLNLAPAEVEQVSSISSWGQALRAAIGMRRFLIIIDDAWSLEHVQALTIGGPNCMYLLTTRLPQLALAFAQAGIVEVPELEEQEGLALLTHYVPQIVQQHSAEILELVRAVGALPLALTLMGKYLAAQALSGQPRRLQTALHYLRDPNQRLSLKAPLHPNPASDGLAEQPPLSVYSAIALSIQPLDVQAQESLSALAIFPPKPNSFSEEAALAVSQASAEALDALWDAGLLESSGAGRYTLHQTIIDYLSAQGSHPQAGQRLVAYMLQFLQQHELHQDALEDETANVLVALDAALSLNLHQALLQELPKFVPFMQVQGLELVHRLGSVQLMSQTLIQWGNIHLQQKQLDAARHAFREALELNNNSQSNLEVSALAQYGLAQLALMKGERDMALHLGHQSLASLEALAHKQAQEVKNWLERL